MSLIPLPYRIGMAAVFCGLLFVFGCHVGKSHVQAKWDAQRAATQSAELSAVDKRLTDNTKIATQQAGFNEAIKKAKSEDLAPVIAAIAADRVRIGPALCPRFAAAPEAAGASRSDDADHVASGVQSTAERDLVALKIEVAKSLATGRAAQKFINDNGLAP